PRPAPPRPASLSALGSYSPPASSLAAGPLQLIPFIIQNDRWYHPRFPRLPDVGPPWQSNDMDDSRFLDCLAADYAALRQAATAADTGIGLTFSVNLHGR
ncbi:MAG: hypothetical protein ACRDPY_10910, partial [Streptosporangiaceae bacterium]